MRMNSIKLKARLSHPRNLLGNTAKYGYESAERSVVGHWITFRLQNVKRVILKKTAVMNSRYSDGVKSVSISGSADNWNLRTWWRSMMSFKMN